MNGKQNVEGKSSTGHIFSAKTILRLLDPLNSAEVRDLTLKSEMMRFLEKTYSSKYPLTNNLENSNISRNDILFITASLYVLHQFL